MHDKNSDGMLLGEYARTGNSRPFEVVLRRHAGLVMGVCRRILGNEHDAEDAAQAVYLVLAAKARSHAGRESVAGWLHHVARHVSLRAGESATRRKERELKAASNGPHRGPEAEERWNELRPILDRELDALPERFRLPVILIHLEGFTKAQVAERLAWREGTVSSRLSRGMALLRARFARRGVAITAVLLGALIRDRGTETVAEEAFVLNACKAVALVSAGNAAANESISANAAALSKGVLKMMAWTRIKKIAATLVVACVLACTATWAALEPGKASTETAGVSTPAGKKIAYKRAANTELRQLAEGGNAFAAAMFRGLSSKVEGNLFVSPFSIRTALAMTYAGAGGQTAAEMKRALRFDLKDGRLDPSFHETMRSMAEAGKKGVELSVANALWGQQGYTFLQPFLNTNATFYDGGFHTVDFVTKTETARLIINRWVEDRTKKKIKDLIPPGGVTGDTKLVLTNAVYFFGHWAVQFDKKRTKQEPFHLLGGSTPSVPLMRFKKTEKFRYFVEPSFRAVELPYRGDRMAMTVLLPRKKEGLAELEKNLSPAQFSGYLKKMDQVGKQKVDVILPRFRLTWGTEDLGPKGLGVLPALGMREAFEFPAADFSRMDGTRELYIGAVLHKAFVDVNEEGTEAAAATVVTIESFGRPSAPPVFRADHPFLFLIRDLKTGSVLFMGRVADPRG